MTKGRRINSAKQENLAATTTLTAATTTTPTAATTTLTTAILVILIAAVFHTRLITITPEKKKNSEQLLDCRSDSNKSGISQQQRWGVFFQGCRSAKNPGGNGTVFVPYIQPRSGQNI